MIRNYVLIAWRQLRRQRFFSLLSILALTAGLSVAFLIAGYVWSENHVNSQIRNLSQQYIINSQWKDPSMGYDITSLGQLPPTLYENYPDLVRSYYRYDGITSNVSRGANVFRESIQVGDTTLIAMFGFKVTEGDAVHAFDGPGKVVLSEQAAKKYFGNEPAVGSLLSIENFSGGRRDFEVTAVLAPMERNSVTQLLGDFSNEVFLSIHDLDFFGRDMDWENNTIPAYIELQPGVSPDALIQPIRRLVASHTSERIAENYSPVLVPLSKVYLRANNGVIQRNVVPAFCHGSIYPPDGAHQFCQYRR